MINVMTIVNFFIDFAINSDEEKMTNARINKLLYFAQGWHLARTGRPLFKANIQAWPLGPVVPVVYNKLKKYNDEKILSIIGDYSPSSISSEELSLLIDVMNCYGSYPTSKLISMTHKKDSPWAKVYKEHHSNIIEQNSIRNYFLTQTPLTSLKKDYSNKEYVGFIDENNHVVLPAEMDDGWN